jgi:ABC-type antimicrobial peptide transport system permease subunit
MKEPLLVEVGFLFQLGVGMPCKSCGSVNQRKISAEMGIRFLGLKNIDKPIMWISPELIVCLDCGTAEFAVPDAELRQLAKGDAATVG